MRGVAQPKRPKQRKDLTKEHIDTLLHYNPETGEFTWKPRPAGSAQSQGYKTINIGGLNIKAHQVAWIMMTGAWPKHHIDHINGKRSDNRFCNLRESTPQQNCFNRKTRSDNKSGHVGVIFYKRNKKWGAYVNTSGKRTFVGLFDTFEKAVTARNAKALELHGQFSKKYRP